MQHMREGNPGYTSRSKCIALLYKYMPESKVFALTPFIGYL